MAVDTKVIERAITIEASPETVFRLLTDPNEYVRWKGRIADLDARAGGQFRIQFADPKQIASGKYVEVVPNRRVVFTWGWEGDEMVPPGSSTVEISLEPAGRSTRLRLVHRGLPEAGVQTHAAGWDFFLGRLEDVAEGRPPREPAKPDEK